RFLYNFKLTFYRAVLKFCALSFTSGILFSQLYSYSAENIPLKFWRFNSACTSFSPNFPVPQGTSCAFLLPNSFRSLKWRCTILPSNFFRQSIGFKPERIQWPTSAVAPIRLLRPSKAFKTTSGFQYMDGVG